MTTMPPSLPPPQWPPSQPSASPPGAAFSAPPTPVPPKRAWYRRARVLAPAALLVGIGIGASGNDGKTVTNTTALEPGATTTVTATAPSSSSAASSATVRAKHSAPKPTTATASFDGDGTYLVPADVKPGTYRSGKPDSGNCYWERLKDPAGGFGAIIANDNSEGQSVVTIKKTDKAFKTSGCGTCTRVG